ncbi:MAG: hypothetical protein ACKVIN_17920 [Longimicrobiales bacterium]
MKRHSTILPSILLLAACVATDTGSNGETEEVLMVANAAVYGGCIQTSPVGEVPEDVYAVSEIAASDEYQPFTKTLTAGGLVLVAGDEASDDFMRLVSRAISEMFAPSEGLDLETRTSISLTNPTSNTPPVRTQSATSSCRTCRDR